MSRTFFGPLDLAQPLELVAQRLLAPWRHGELSHFLVLLQRTHRHLAGAELGDRAHGGARRGQRRVVGNALEQGVAADRERILDRLRARRRVDDQVDAAVQQAVHDVRPPLAHLVDALDVEAAAGQELVRADGGDDLEAEVDEPLGDRDRARPCRCPAPTRTRSRPSAAWCRRRSGSCRTPSRRWSRCP
jgi:hypothetical protein